MEDLQDGIPYSIDLCRLQDKLCSAGGVYGCSYDRNGKRIGEISGPEQEVQLLKEYIPENRCRDIWEKVHTSRMEDLLVEDTAFPWLKIAAVDPKPEANYSISWMFFAVLSDLAEGDERAGAFSRVIDRKHFSDFADLATEVGHILLKNQVSRESAEIESYHIRNSRQEMSRSLEYMKAVMAVVQLLYREDSVRAVMGDFLEITGNYLDVSHAGIYRLCPEKSEMELAVQWERDSGGNSRGSGLNPVLSVDKALVRKFEKPLVLSGTGTGGSIDIRAEISGSENGSAAVAILPVRLYDAGGMYVCYAENEKEKNWEIEELRYIKETVKILQLVVAGRSRKNSQAGSFATQGGIPGSNSGEFMKNFSENLPEYIPENFLCNLLDNIGCGIYVKDLETGKLEFANRYVRNIFSEELEKNVLDEIFSGREDAGTETGNYEVYDQERGAWYDFYYATVTWADDRKVRLCSFYDISDKKIVQRKIDQQAYTDFATGLYNRMRCERDMIGYIAEAKRNGTKGVLLYLALHPSKKTNDNPGYGYGDLLLQEIADGLRRVSGLSESCYRLGEKEFAVIIPPEYYEKQEAVMEQVETLFCTPFQLNGIACSCTVNVGRAVFPDDGESVDELVEKAENTEV